MPSSVDLASAYAESGVAEVLDQLDRELIGLAPVKTRIREIAALLLVDQALLMASRRVQETRRLRLLAISRLTPRPRMPTLSLRALMAV